MSYPASTTGLAVSAKVVVDANTVTLSVSGANSVPTTHQIVPQVEDVSGAASPGVVLTLTAAANASSGTTVYTGTITGGGSNALKGRTYTVAGFDTTANNGTFTATASSTTTLTLDNAAGVSDTHAGTATEEGANAFTFVSRNASFATVSATGLITAVAKGNANIAVDYPVFDNNLGNNPDGTPAEKIGAGVYVNVIP